MKDAYSEIFASKQKIMLVMAHPDDAEIFAGGTIARLVVDNKEVRIVKMTSGNKGSGQQKTTEQELSRLRLKEDSDAMKILGIKPKNQICLDLGDGQVENDIATIGKVAQQIRLFRPDIVITHNPEQAIIRFSPGENWVNHRDHRQTGLTALDASYPYSRDLLFFPEHFQDKLAQSHVVKEFLLVDYYDHPDVVGIDVTKFISKKVSALAAHSSQYPLVKAQASADFFTKNPNGRNYERFRYVVAD